MFIEHADYVELKKQLQGEFDARYILADECEKMRHTETSRIDSLKEEFAMLREEVRVDRAKTNTRLNILIGILSVIAVPIIGVCVQFLLN